MHRVLVSCPTYSGKDYCLKEYLEAYNNFTYKDKELLMVRNNGKGNYFNESWKKIIDKAIEIGAEYIFSCEADNINPPETIEVLLDTAKKYNAVIVAHDYPYMEGDYLTALGCTLIRTDYLKDFVPHETITFESYIYKIAQQKRLPYVELSGVLKTEHLWHQV